MGFVSILKKIGDVAGQQAPDIVSSFNPALGALAGTVLNAVVLSESKLGSGNGEAKKAEVMGILQVAVPLILKVVEASTGRDLVDDVRFAAGMEKLNDGIVDVLNAFHILPKAAKAA